LTHSRNTFDRLLALGAYTVLLVYPATMFVYDGIRSEYFGVLFLLSLLGLLARRFRLSFRSLERIDRWVLLAFASITIVAWLSWAGIGFDPEAKGRIAKYSWFLLAVPMFSLFRHLRLRMEVVWLGLVIGAWVAFGRAMLEEFKLVEELAWERMRGRANGVMHPIRFGDLSLLLGFIALAGALYLEGINRLARAIGIGAFVAGILASVLSQSRGGWLAAPLLLAVALLPLLKGKSRGYKAAVVGGIALGLAGLMTLPGLDMGKRFGQAKADLKKYFVQGNPRSSLGARLNMYETAIHAFQEHPVFGVGVGRYHEYSLRYFEQNKDRLSREIIIWKNPHNELLLHAATRGSVGVVTLLALFLLLCYRFAVTRHDPGGRTRFASVAGLMLVLGYAVFGMSIALFEHRDFLMFFVIYAVLFLAETGWRATEMRTDAALNQPGDLA